MTTSSDKQEQKSWMTHAQLDKQIRPCAEKALAAVEKRLSLRIPKTEQERLNAFTVWLESWHEKIGLEFQKQFEKEFIAAIGAAEDTETVHQFTQEIVWPQWEKTIREHFLPKLLSYAVLSQACAWGRKNMGDAGMYGDPRRDGEVWRVTLGVLGYSDNLGQITLDADGNIVLNQTTTRQEILERIHDLTPLSA